MAQLLKFKTNTDKRGCLTVLEKEIPFPIRRIFYIYNVDDSKRGFHKHKKTKQVAICIRGRCDIIIENSRQEKFTLNHPEKGLLLEPEDYHWMEKFSKDAMLLILASEYYDEKDYIRHK